MILRQWSAERTAAAQHDSTGAVAMYTLLPRRCYKGKRRVTSSSTVPTWTGDHSLKNLRSFHLGYLRVDDCRRKKNRRNNFSDPTDYLLAVPALCLQAFATHRHKTFVSRFSNGETVMSELFFLWKYSYFPRPRKYWLDLFPRHIDLGCASVNMQAQKIIAGIFSASGKSNMYASFDGSISLAKLKKDVKKLTNYL